MHWACSAEQYGPVGDAEWRRQWWYRQTLHPRIPSLAISTSTGPKSTASAGPDANAGSQLLPSLRNTSCCFFSIACQKQCC